MQHFFVFNTLHQFRNALLTAALVSCLLGASSGCAIFNKKTDNDTKISEFEEDPEESGEDKENETTVFDSERKKQSDMSDFVASFGRKSKNQKDVDPGQTFLMSDKAKEIYANTER